MQSGARLIFTSPFNEGIAFVSLFLGAQGRRMPHPEETRILSPRATAKRRTEFLLGRAAASFALKQLGFDNPPPVLQGERREPLWPEGIVGSITHCGPWAIAAAARRSVALTIGIDLERVSGVHTDLNNLICHPTELDWIGTDQAHSQRLAMIFSAKESTFKAFYPLCKRFIDFQEVRLMWRPGQQRFLGELRTNLTPDFRQGYQFEVGCSCSGDILLTYLVL